MPMILGKKVGMTRIYDASGKMIPVTVIQAGPCSVLQVKTVENDGYNAVQLGYDDIKPARRRKPAVGHAHKGGTVPKRFVREMRLPAGAELPYQIGDSVTVSSFADIKLVDIIGMSKGKGFAGPMKRHGFGGFPASHGTERKHRAPGSQAGVAANAGRSGGPKKGKRMGGQMGNVRVTTRNHPLVSIDGQNHLLVVKGPVPGPPDGYCIVRCSKKV
ncbi:MAG TPA: 50S ribosomal protein L3 [Phycisphaerales bacterium]|nr:50S ribosomal protein L3 [Phycisphaerales bacterium]